MKYLIIIKYYSVTKYYSDIKLMILNIKYSNFADVHRRD